MQTARPPRHEKYLVKIDDFEGNLSQASRYFNVHPETIRKRYHDGVRGKALVAPVTKHGRTKSSTYQTWRDMKQRCYNPKCSLFKWYGAKGIGVCARWIDSFESFLEDMGEKPKGKTLDRINVNGDYEPSNCRWATKKEQANNTTTNVVLSVPGFRGTLAQISERFQIPSPTLRGRYREGKRGADLIAPVQTKFRTKAMRGL